MPSKFIRNYYADFQSRTKAQATETYVLATQEDFAAHRNDEKLEKIVQWLSKADPSPNLHSARKKQQTGTGDWLINGTDFEEWKITPGLLEYFGSIFLLSSFICRVLKKGGSGCVRSMFRVELSQNKKRKAKRRRMRNRRGGKQYVIGRI